MRKALTLSALRARAPEHKRATDEVLTVCVGDDALSEMRCLPNLMQAPYRTMEAKPHELGCVEIFRFYSVSGSGWTITGAEPA